MLRFLTLALLLAAPIFAADIDGKWTEEIGRQLLASRQTAEVPGYTSVLWCK